jgi:hypothetical protein
MNDTESFIQELMLFLTEDDIFELTEKAGVRFPLQELSWVDLCYICCWMGIKRELPGSIHNRMVLGEHNQWVRIYLAGSQIKKTDTVNELFNLAG